MKGHLHLTASADAAGRTYLSAQSFRAPLHLSKPHTDEGALVVNVVNPTAGLFDSDEVEMHVKVEPGAHIVLTTPGAGRVHRSRTDRAAMVSQYLEVAPGGFAEYFPEVFIPQGGARYSQRTTLRVAPGGRLLYCEWLAPGRVASGEAFAYEELLWDTDLWCADTLTARERYRLTPHDDSLASLKTISAAAHYMAFFAVGWPAWSGDALTTLSHEGAYLGCGQLAGDAPARVIKIICQDSLQARKVYHSVRNLLYRELGKKEPAVRRM
jgi:urease accessory protein